MRLASLTAGVATVLGLAASVASAFFFVEFAVVVTIVAILIAVLPVGIVPGAKGTVVRQKVTLQADDGFAFLTRGQGSSPDSLSLSGSFRITKAKPAPASPVDPIQGFVAFPVTAVNSAETRGSLRAGNEELATFRDDIDDLLTYVANYGAPPGVVKSSFDLIGGEIVSSDSKQSGAVKVDSTFSRLSGKVTLAGDAYVLSGPMNGADVKYKLKVKFKPRRASF